MDRLSFISFNSPISYPGLNSKEGGLQFVGSSGGMITILSELYLQFVVQRRKNKWTCEFFVMGYVNLKK
jgi:hypothetical protein